ncbi:MAG: heparan-alpha-glucosaminide N-acetyltransferase domain-containing protein, partial [Alistipes sp.]|nr:heparan-alpha-glucosaminide N-acetyltransferase domain-containing protein [Alistipes sp.]
MNQSPKPQRLESLDTLRGFDMMFIMGVSGLIVALCALSPNGFSDWIRQGMEHVDWNGLTQHDTIFPLFLFIAGISFPYSHAKQLQNGASCGAIHRKIITRGLTLFGLGLIYNGLLSLNFHDLRYMSVLGRIGLAWMFAALLFVHCGWRVRSGIALLILVGYWLLLRLVSAPDMPEAAQMPFGEENLVGYIDRMLLPGTLCYGTFDPEGLLSTLPAIVTAMLGMLTGEFVRQSSFKGSASRKSLYM